ncbi:MAG: ester cyclase [Gemmatimonadota bacterium]
MSDTTRNKELVRRFVDAVNARNFVALEEILAPDFHRHCPATPDVEVRSPDDFRRFIESDAAAVPDSRVTLETVVGEGDRVAFWATYSGTQSGQMGPFSPSNRWASLEFAGVFRIDGDRIAHVAVTWDNVSFLSQLGHMPPMPTP